MPANGRFGGHIVSGHIDGVGTILSVHRDDNALWYTVRAAPELLRYVVEKGSVTEQVFDIGAFLPGLGLVVLGTIMILVFHRMREGQR